MSPIAAQRTVTAVAVAALSVAYCYDVHFPHVYFVQKQMHEFLPRSVWNAANRMKLFDISPELVVVLVAAPLAAVLFVAAQLRRAVHQRVEASSVRFWRVAYGAVIVIALTAFALMKRSGLVDGLERWDMLLLVLVLAGAVVVVLDPERQVGRATGLLIFCSIAAFALLFAARYPVPRSHPYYLYTDRYLFSEVMPLGLVLAAVGAHAVVEEIARLRAHVRLQPAIAVRGAGRRGPRSRRTGGRDPAHHGPYPLRRLLRHDAPSRPAGRRPRTGADRVFGVEAVASRFLYGDSYRVFAVPLAETFDRRIIGTNFRNGLPDPVFDPAGPAGRPAPCRPLERLPHRSSRYRRATLPRRSHTRLRRHDRLFDPVAAPQLARSGSASTTFGCCSTCTSSPSSDSGADRERQRSRPGAAAEPTGGRCGASDR